MQNPIFFHVIVNFSGNSTISGKIKVGSTVRVKKSVTRPKWGWGDIGYQNYESVGVVISITNFDLLIDFPWALGWKGFLDDMELA